MFCSEKLISLDWLSKAQLLNSIITRIFLLRKDLNLSLCSGTEVGYVLLNTFSLK